MWAQSLIANLPIDGDEPIDWFPLVAAFVGGLGLFLYGLRELTDALKLLAGDRLREVLGRLTRNRVAGMLTGAAATAVLQASAVTAVVAVGFVSVGVLTVVQAVSVVLGANIGTTVTAQIISFDINSWALILVAFGAFGVMSARRKRWHPQARVLLGLGLLFVAMQIMAEGMAPLRGSSSFIDLMTRLDEPALGVLVGTVYTALIRSSSATTALAITMANEQLISLEAGVAIIIGANVGTCVTVAFAAIGSSRPAMRVAAAHVAINVFGALVWVGFTGQLSEVARWVTGGDQVARQLANAHTIFNVSIALVLLPFLGPLVRLLELMIPDEVDRGPKSALEPGLLGTPSMALKAVRVELGRLADTIAGTIEQSAATTIGGSWRELAQLARDDDVVDERYRSIVEYLRAIGSAELTREQADELFVLLAAADDLENMGDVLEVNLATLGERRIELGIHLGSAASQHVREVAAEVARAVSLVATAVKDADVDAARDVQAMKPGINALLAHAFTDQAGRLVADGKRNLEPFALERDVLEALRRIYYFAKRTAAGQVSARALTPDVDPA
jgi:phosphate:Na+ symporter